MKFRNAVRFAALEMMEPRSTKLLIYTTSREFKALMKVVVCAAVGEQFAQVLSTPNWVKVNPPVGMTRLLPRPAPPGFERMVPRAGFAVWILVCQYRLVPVPLNDPTRMGLVTP